MPDFREEFMKHLDSTPLPPLGDDRTRLTWEFTETDLNTIAFAVSFVRHALTSAPLPRLRAHYGDALEKLERRLRREVTPSRSAWQRFVARLRRA